LSSPVETTIIDVTRIIFEVTWHHPELNIKPAPSGSVQRRVPNIAKLMKLNFEPQVGLLDGIRACWKPWNSIFAWTKHVACDRHTTSRAEHLSVKQIELLQEISPQGRRIAAICLMATAANGFGNLRAVRDAASKLWLMLEKIKISYPDRLRLLRRT
jgi:hypothetical protein